LGIGDASSEYLLTKVATIQQSSSSDESVSVLGNRNMNLRKLMSWFRFLLNPDLLRLKNKINYDHGRGPLTVGAPVPWTCWTPYCYATAI